MLKNLFVRKKIILLLVFIATFLIGFSVFYSNFRKPQYVIAEAKKITINQIVSASGEIKSENEVELKFPVSGKLNYLAVKKNDPIKKWGYIASLDKKELLKTLNKSLRDYSKERWDFEQDKEVTYKGAVMTDTVRRILEKNQFDLDKAVMDVELSDFAAKNADLYSPIEGVITKVYTQAGTSVVAGITPIVTVANPDKIYFIARVDESNIAGVSPGQETTIKLDAFNKKKFTGKVIEVDYDATVTNGNKAYFVKIALDDQTRVKMSMSGEVEIITLSRPNVIAIPKFTITEKEGKKYVVVLENERLKQRRLITGIESNDGLVEVNSGLNVGDKVVLPSKKK